MNQPNNCTRTVTADPKSGAETLTSRCPKGHKRAMPNKGLGRANIAAWETGHQDCIPQTEEVTTA